MAAGASSYVPCSGRRSPLPGTANCYEPDERTPLLGTNSQGQEEQPQTNSNDGNDNKNQEKINCSRSIYYLKHILACSFLCLVFLIGLVAGIWLYVDLPGDAGIRSRYAVPPIEIISRQQYGLVLNFSLPTLTTGLAKYVIVADLPNANCSTIEDCKQEIFQLQTSEIQKNKQAMPYNFFIGGDNNIYEGRGWYTKGNISSILDSRAISVAFIGNYDVNYPSPKLFTTFNNLVKNAVKYNKLFANYYLIAQSQVADTTSPGRALFRKIRRTIYWLNCSYDECANYK